MPNSVPDLRKSAVLVYLQFNVLVTITGSDQSRD